MNFGTRVAVARCHTARSMRTPAFARLPIAHKRPRARTGGGNRRDLNHVAVARYQNENAGRRPALQSRKRNPAFKDYLPLGLPAVEVYHAARINVRFALNHTDLCLPMRWKTQEAAVGYLW